MPVAVLTVRTCNKNPSVQIFNYVTEGTFDTVMWQTVEKKGTLHCAAQDREHHRPHGG